jgi:tRNA G18 (ribose-2'-O)-methylase SpoU
MGGESIPLSPVPYPLVSPPLEALLDNIRSAGNVGSMFRTADGAGLRRLHLCGITATPKDPSIAKTSLGAHEHLPWNWHADGVAAALELREEGCRLWALEGVPGAELLFEALLEPEGRPVVLVVGNELCGVDPGILELCERILYIPMQGVKRSLNAAVAFGVAVYWLASGNQLGK